MGLFNVSFCGMQTKRYLDIRENDRIILMNQLWFRYVSSLYALKSVHLNVSIARIEIKTHWTSAISIENGDSSFLLIEDLMPHTSYSISSLV